MIEKFPNNYAYKSIPIGDTLSQDIQQYIDECIEFIEKGNVVFVHCAAGVSRSASIVIAYVMNKNKWSFTKAHDYVKKKRNQIYPNPNFKNQLRNYQKQLGIETEEEFKEIDLAMIE